MRWGGNGISLWLRLQGIKKSLQTLRDQIWPPESCKPNKRHSGTYGSGPLAVLAGGLGREGSVPMKMWVLL